MDKLKWAVSNGDIESLEKNLTADADLTTLLIKAADYDQPDIIKFLIKKGASVNKEDQHKITPLLAAIYENHVKAAETLINSGANKVGVAPDGSSYLDLASSDAMRCLLK